MKMLSKAIVLFTVCIFLGSCVHRTPDHDAPSVIVEPVKIVRLLKMVNFVYSEAEEHGDKDIEFTPDMKTSWSFLNYKVDKYIWMGSCSNKKKQILGAFIVSKTNPKELIIAFRGTMSKQDLKRDFQFAQVRFNLFSPKKEKELNLHKIRAERGFYGMYNQVRNQIMLYIQNHIKTYGNESKITFTGHSAGSVVSLYATFDAIESLNIKAEFYGYATPIGMNKQFVVKLIELVKKLRLFPIFVTNERDIVPRLPSSFFGYQGFPVNSYLDICFENFSVKSRIDGNHDSSSYLDVLSYEFGFSNKLKNPDITICE